MSDDVCLARKLGWHDRRMVGHALPRHKTFCVSRLVDQNELNSLSSSGIPQTSSASWPTYPSCQGLGSSLSRMIGACKRRIHHPRPSGRSMVRRQSPLKPHSHLLPTIRDTCSLHREPYSCSCHPPSGELRSHPPMASPSNSVGRDEAAAPGSVAAANSW